MVGHTNRFKKVQQYKYPIRIVSASGYNGIVGDYNTGYGMQIQPQQQQQSPYESNNYYIPVNSKHIRFNIIIHLIFK
jgi:hypothetical protein